MPRERFSTPLSKRQFYRDNAFAHRLQRRIKTSASELLLLPVRRRLYKIHHDWIARRPALSYLASCLLNIDTSELTVLDTGAAVLAHIRIRGALLKIPCVIVARVQPFNRFKVAPVNGSGSITVNCANIELLDKTG
jgi:hypothetical protein